MHKVLLRSLVAVGLLLTIVGFIFRLQNWNDMLYGTYTGPAILVLGIGLWIFMGKPKHPDSGNK